MKNRLNPLAAAIAASLAFSMTPAFAGRTPRQPEGLAARVNNV